MEVQTKKLAVVTGASTGIGYELAKECARRGFDVVIAADESEIYAAAGSIRDLGVEVTPVEVDLAKPEGVRELYQRIRDRGRPIDALLLNAGVGVNGRFDQIRLEDDLNLINLNITSVVHLAKLALPAMLERGEGRLLLTASVAALMPGPFYATYAASKSFVLSFAEALHNEMKDTGITVTALLPGPTDTKFFERANMLDTKAGQSKKDDPAEVAKQGVDAMLKGDDYVVAGSILNKLQSFSTRFLSEQQRAALHRVQIEPGSAA